METELATSKLRRSEARDQLTRNPTSPEAAALSTEITRLNRLVTATERSLSYAVTEPVSAEPVLIEYHGKLPLELLPPVKVAKVAWDRLSDSERTSIEEKWAVQPLAPNAYGVILESQTLDRSTPGTTTGAAIGSTFAQTTYIDRSFRGGNSYSATNQLVLGLVGAIAGSSLDQGPTEQYQTRYSIRLADGSIQMIDEVKGDPFRLPISACVQFPSLEMNDQTLCNQTAESLRDKFLSTQRTNHK